MITQKAGTILLNLQTKKIALVYDNRNDSYAFPKGHLEIGETLAECAIRETEEETLRANHLFSEKEIGVLKYVTSSGINVECFMYIAIDDGPTSKNIAAEDREIFDWFYFNEVHNKLVYEDLKIFWNQINNRIAKILF